MLGLWWLMNRPQFCELGAQSEIVRRDSASRSGLPGRAATQRRGRRRELRRGRCRGTSCENTFCSLPAVLRVPLLRVCWCWWGWEAGSASGQGHRSSRPCSVNAEMEAAESGRSPKKGVWGLPKPRSLGQFLLLQGESRSRTFCVELELESVFTDSRVGKENSI